MTKITYPIAQMLPGEALHSFDYKLRANTSLKVTQEGDNVVIENGGLNLSINDLISILNAGGEVENYLMVIKAELNFLTANVPANMPDRTKPTATGVTPRAFNDWVSPNNFWVNDTHFYFLSQTVAGTNLTATQIRLLASAGATVLLVSDPEFIAIQNA